MQLYGRLYRVVEPKRARLNAALAQLQEKQAALAEAQEKLREVRLAPTFTGASFSRMFYTPSPVVWPASHSWPCFHGLPLPLAQKANCRALEGAGQRALFPGTPSKDW